MNERYRLSDAERDAAVAALSEAYVDGRLTQGEFEERMEAATSATYSTDLQPLFTDLPTRAGVEIERAAPSRAKANSAARAGSTSSVGQRRSAGPRPYLGFFLVPLAAFAAALILLGGWLPILLLVFLAFKFASFRAASYAYSSGATYGPAYGNRGWATYRGCGSGRHQRRW